MIRSHVLVCGGTGCTSSGSVNIRLALEEEINLSRHVDMADIVAYIPSIVIVGIYFIAPICISAVVGTGDIFAIMEEFNKENAGLF